MFRPKFPQHSPKKKFSITVEAQNSDLASRSVDGLSTSLSSNSEVFRPMFPICQSGFIDLGLSGDFEHLAPEAPGLASLPSLARTKNGSKRLQQMIAKSRPEEIEKIVDVLLDHMGELMVDVYGNYMCQTLVQSCSAAQRLRLLGGMREHLIAIACDAKGTHALQTLIALANLSDEESIYQQCFSGKIVLLSKDKNASHVVQRLLATVKNTHFIIKEILTHVTELATDKLGLCVIKKCTKNPQVFCEIMGNCMVLMQDPYGNYAVQSVIEIWGEECSFEFCSNIQNKAAQLCIQKYASNVMEKAMKIETARKAILRELIREDKLDLMLASPYGGYVLKTAVKEADREEKEEVAQCLNSITQKLHNSKIQVQWEEIMSILS
jgi:hypothetical protein